MTTAIFNDNAILSMKIALDGLSRRQEVISNNLANVDTPGYQSQTLNFEDAVRIALNKAESLPLRTTNSAHLGGAAQDPGFLVQNRAGGTARADGNNVDIDAELTDMTETGVRYQTLSQMASKKLLLLKSIAQAS